MTTSRVGKDITDYKTRKGSLMKIKIMPTVGMVGVLLLASCFFWTVLYFHYAYGISIHDSIACVFRDIPDGAGLK